MFVVEIASSRIRCYSGIFCLLAEREMQPYHKNHLSTVSNFRPQRASQMHVKYSLLLLDSAKVSRKRTHHQANRSRSYMPSATSKHSDDSASGRRFSLASRSSLLSAHLAD